MADHDSERDARIRAVLARVLRVPESEIGEETRFTEDFGGDSMMTLEVLSELEREFGISIPEENLPRLVHLAATRQVLNETLNTERAGA
jgi:acyl carrier protein